MEELSGEHDACAKASAQHRCAECEARRSGGRRVAQVLRLAAAFVAAAVTVPTIATRLQQQSLFTVRAEAGRAVAAEHRAAEDGAVRIGNWFSENPFKDRGSTATKEKPAPGAQPPFGGVTDGKVAKIEGKAAAKASSSFVTAAVRAVGPAVVRIDTERTVPSGTGFDPLFDDPVFKKFFGDDIQKQLPRERTERGQGSGFIISEDGLLVTNAHVVNGASKVTVTLTDGRSFMGVVKGNDDLLDLAVVKIETKGMSVPVAPLGISDDLQVGDWVIAVGNPLGLDNTVTLGIVSSLNRSAAEVGIPEKRLNFIQTDAAINPGNSGGTLVNEFGEVVGINTAIRANAEGIGFAIPIDRAKSIIGELAKGKKIQHSFLGVQMVSLTPEFARLNNEDPNAPVIIPEIDGVIVVRVLPKSPAAEAGVRRFDIIQSIDGVTIKTAKEVQALIDRTKVGQTVTMRVVRGDRPLDLPVKTGDLNLSTSPQPQQRPLELSPSPPSAP